VVPARQKMWQSPMILLWMALLMEQQLHGSALVLRRMGTQMGDEVDDALRDKENSMELAAAKVVAKIGKRYARGLSFPLHSGQLGEVHNPNVSLTSLRSHTSSSSDEAMLLSLDSLPFSAKTSSKSMSEEQYKNARSMHQKVIVFGSYHKTGTELVLTMIREFTGKPGGAYWNCAALGKGHPWVFTKDFMTNYYFNPAVPIIRVLPHYRFVHFIRDPLNLVVSAYRYHAAGMEKWLFTPVRRANNAGWLHKHRAYMHELEEPNVVHPFRHVLGRFRKAVEQGASLYDYYQAAEEEEGVVVEAFRSWPEIQMLLANYNLTRKDPQTLQVRMESVQADYHGTMKCMFKFLRDAMPLDVKQALKTVEPLDVAKHPQNAGGGADHVTRGRYDNSKLLKVLQGIQPLREAERRLAKPAVCEC